MIMDNIMLLLNRAYGEKAAADFIKSIFSEKDEATIRRMISSIPLATKREKKLISTVLLKEKYIKDAFPQNGYRKGDDGFITTGTDLKKPVENPKNVKSESESHPSGKKKHPKFQPLFIEGAQSDQLVSILPGRHPCQCLATKHQLINNCITCGRIVCKQEGSGPCFYCGNLVCTQEEKEFISSGSNKATKLRNRLLQLPWAPGVETPPYRLKRKLAKMTEDSFETKDHVLIELDEENESDYYSAEEGFGTVVNCLNSGAQERFERGLATAITNRNRLLEYDATAVRRTRVLDDEMDYFVTSGGSGGTAWLSPEVRERIANRVAELRAQRHASRLQSSAFTIDLASGSVIEEDMRDDAARQLYQPTQEELERFESSVLSKENDPSKHCMTENINIADPSVGFPLPKFIPQSLISHQTSKPKNRLLEALNQPMANLRLQDEASRALVDEGFCLSMHQPWASFLIRGIKRDEGRTWYSTHRGCLWIASTAKQPDPDEIKEMETSYLNAGGCREDLPNSYPVGYLLGRVNVVDVLAQEEYRDKYPDGESESPYVFICDDPREVLLKLPIRGQHKIYKLEKHIHQAALKNMV